MHYDLGLAYQGAGDIEQRLAEFQKVYAVRSRVPRCCPQDKGASEGRFISLDQLKDDIEKEISSKFLEEGERIEREEKTKKNERVTAW